MRHGLLATASSAVIIFAATTASVSAQTAAPSGEVVLRGAYDVGARTVAPKTPQPGKPNRLGLADGLEPMGLSTMLTATMSASQLAKTAQQIAKTVFGWDGKATGKGVIIGIVDSGIDLDHPEFTGRILTGNCFAGFSSICTVAGAMMGGDPGINPSQDTHGTHVAGIAAGTTTGLATEAKILPVKVCDTYSSNCPGDSNAGMVWASQHGASVINLSLGGSSLFSTDIAAAAKAIANGALIVVAAGNGGYTNPVAGYLGGAALKPGVRGGMIVVGAIDNSNVIASFSQTPGSTCETYGGTQYCMRDYYVVAPGKGIMSSVGGGNYNTMSGTSMATPYVTGLAALIKGQWSSLTPFQIADIIFRTADDLGAPGPDNVYGRGVVDVAAAMSPVGGSAVLAVTGGTTTTTATGTAGVLSTASKGVLSVPLENSKLLKSVVLVDVYGRTFNADLTKLALTEGFSLSNMLSDPFRSVMPMSVAETGAFGTVSMSGFVENAKLPEALNANAALSGAALNTTEHVAVSLSPVNGVSLDFGHNMAMSGTINSYDLRANPGENTLLLSGSALNSPYLGLADGGDFSGATISPIDGVRLRVGYASVGQDQTPIQLLNGRDPNDPANAAVTAPKRQASSVVASLAWDFSSWGGLGLTASQVKEQNSVLGGYTSGAFSVANDAGTSSIGISARMNLGGNWMANAAWNQGTTRLGLAQSGLLTNADTLRSRASGVALARRNLFGDDTLAFALSRPLYIYQGGATLRAATGVDENQNLVFSTENLSLAASTPETDMEMGYVTHLLGGAVVLQGSAAYQMDVSGRSGKDAVTALGRASFQF